MQQLQAGQSPGICFTPTTLSFILTPGGRKERSLKASRTIRLLLILESSFPLLPVRAFSALCSVEEKKKLPWVSAVLGPRTAHLGCTFF